MLEGLSVALANIDAMIELIRRSPSPADAKEGLMARTWEAGPVTAMLERAGAAASRPENLEAVLGLVEGVRDALAGIDAEERRHRDVHVAVRDERAEVPQE